MEESNKEKMQNIARSVSDNFGSEKAITIIHGRAKLKGVEEFTMLFQVFIKDMVTHLSPSGCKVLLKFFSLMQYSSHIGVDQKTLSEELHLSVRSINGAVRELTNLNVIIGYKDPQDNRRQVYMMNPHGAWKGDLRKRKKIIKENPNQYKMFEAEGKQTQHSLLQNLKNSD